MRGIATSLIEALSEAIIKLSFYELSKQRKQFCLSFLEEIPLWCFWQKHNCFLVLLLEVLWTFKTQCAFLSFHPHGCWLKLREKVDRWIAHATNTQAIVSREPINTQPNLLGVRTTLASKMCQNLFFHPYTKRKIVVWLCKTTLAFFLISYIFNLLGVLFSVQKWVDGTDMLVSLMIFLYTSEVDDILHCDIQTLHQGWKWIRWPGQSGSFGSLFGGSSGSHPQTKLSGCDPDITCSLENSVGIW